MFYNIAYTSIPIIFYALFEQQAKISHLERNPALYKYDILLIYNFLSVINGFELKWIKNHS